MISGYLLINKQINNSDYEFNLTKSCKFLLISAFYCIIFNTLVVYFNENLSILESFLYSIKNYNFILNFQLGVMNPLWFFQVLIPLYLSAPFLAIIFNKSNKLALVYIIVTLITIMIPLTFDHHKSIFANFFGGIFDSFVSYFILGYIICSERYISKKSIFNKIYFLIIVLFISVFCSIMLYLFFPFLHPTLSNYQSIFIFISSFCVVSIIFKLFKNHVPHKHVEQTITLISQNSFGIFISHILFVYFISSYCGSKGWENPWLVVPYFLYLLSVVFFFLLF
ncbi:hypothetical protein VER_08705 [Veillonella sp. R32]|nr:hypothetical protein VER_08705 [Veillonella sp. R32]